MTMPLAEARDTVEELIMTQHPLWKPDSLEISDKYISWNFGYVSEGRNSAVALTNNFAIGSSKSTSRNRNERVYYRSVDSAQLSTWSRRLKTWYVVSLLNRHGDITKHILHTRDLDDAKRFADAISSVLYHYKRDS